MKLLKELFSGNEFDDRLDYSEEENEKEFDFDFDFENPEPDESEEELDFENRQYSRDYDDMDDLGGEDSGFESEWSDFEDEDYGSEEDYPEGMDDMPHDDYESDGLGGLESDEDLDGDSEAEIENIGNEIKDLYARLAKLAAAGDLDLM